MNAYSIFGVMAMSVFMVALLGFLWLVWLLSPRTRGNTVFMVLFSGTIGVCVIVLFQMTGGEEVTRHNCLVTSTSFDGGKWASVDVETRECGSLRYKGKGDMPLVGHVYDIKVTEGDLGKFEEVKK